MIKMCYEDKNPDVVLPYDSEHVVEHFIVSYISNNNLMFKLDILYKSSSMCFYKQWN